MNDIFEAERAKDKAYEKYQLAKKNLEKSRNSPLTLHSAAQEVNDAWLSFKKAEAFASNFTTLKKIGDLYGC
jgi:hypothetical protein